MSVIMLYYEGPNRHIVIRQGIVGMPSPTDLTPKDASGPISINGKPGIWLDGVNTGAGWVRGLLHVAWEPNMVPVTVEGGVHTLGPESDPGLPRFCTVLGRASETSIAELIAIAQSLTE